MAFCPHPTTAEGQHPWSADHPWKPPPNGVVPDSETAVKIALAILPSLGPRAEAEVTAFQPWTAEAVEDFWQVRGSVRPNYTGGTFVVVIAKQDGRIIGVFHEL